MSSSGSALRAASDPPNPVPRPAWRRNKQESGKRETSDEPKPSSTSQPEVRCLLTKAESDERLDNPEPASPASPKPIPASRMKNNLNSPLANVGLLAAERSAKFRLKTTQDGKKDTSTSDSKESESPGGNRQPVANNKHSSNAQDEKGSESSEKIGEKECSEPSSPKSSSSSSLSSPTHAIRPRTRSKPDASAGIAALVAGFGGAFPGQQPGKKKTQSGPQAPPPPAGHKTGSKASSASESAAEKDKETVPSSNDSCSKKEKDPLVSMKTDLVTNVLHATSDPSPSGTKTPNTHTPLGKTTSLGKLPVITPAVSPKPKRRNPPPEASDDTPAKAKDAETDPKITPSSSPLLSRRFPPQASPRPSPKPSPRVSRTNSPQSSPRSSPILPRKAIMPRPGSPSRFRSVEDEASSTPASPVMPRSPLIRGLKPWASNEKLETEKAPDGDGMSVESGDRESRESTSSLRSRHSSSDDHVKTPQSKPRGKDSGAKKELSTQKSTDSLDFLNLPATLPRLNTDAGRFRSSIGAKGGLANRRKPTRALVRQAYNKKESASDDDIFGAESEASANPIDDTSSADVPESPIGGKAISMKKKFSSLHLKRKISDKSLPTFSVGTPDSPASPLTPKSGRSSTKTKLGGELLVDESPRPRAHTTSGRPLGPPIVLTDLQRSPMMKRRARAEGKDSADEDDAEPSEPTADDHHRGNTPSLGSATTPSMSSMDMLHIESDVGSKSESLALSTDDLTVDRSASRSSSRFQIHTAFDWDERDVVHWVRHKLKRDDLSLHFEAKSIDGQQLLSLDSGKMKAMGITDSKDQSNLKKEIKSLKSQAEKGRKEEKKRRELEAKEEQKRLKAAAKEAKRQEKSKK